MTLPQLNVLTSAWAAIPPPAVQLKRIALALGLPDTKAPVQTSAPAKPEDAMRQAMAGGLPVMKGRPDDPLLDLIGL